MSYMTLVQESKTESGMVVRMMRRLGMAVVIVAALVFLLGQTGKLPKAGDKTPTFSVSTMDGKTLSSADLAKQGPVLLIFIGHSCPTTHVIFKHYNKLDQQVAGSGIKRYMVLDAKADMAKRFIAKHSAKIPVLLDPDKKAFRAFGLTRSPATTLLTKEGKLAKFDLGISRSILTATATEAYKLTGKKAPKMDFSEAPSEPVVGCSL